MGHTIRAPSPGWGRREGGMPSQLVVCSESAQLTSSHSAPWHRAAARVRAGHPSNGPARPSPPLPRQCPARRRGRWRRRRSTPQLSVCCGAHQRPAGSTARSAATRSTTCAWRALRPAGRRASRTSCWPMPRWAGLRGRAWVGGTPGGQGGAQNLCSSCPLAASLSLATPLTTSSLPCRLLPRSVGDGRHGRICK